MRHAIAVLLAAALLAATVRADDYYLSEEEDQAASEEANQGDFVRQFTCLIATQRYINHRQEVWQGMSGGSLFQTNFKRLKARLYSLCLKDIPQSSVDAVQKATSAKDFDQIDFSVVEQTPYNPIFDETESKLSEEDRSNYRAFIKTEDQVREIQKKHKRDNPNQGEDSEEDDTWENVRKSKEPPSLAGLGLGSKPLIVAVGIGFLALAGLVYKLSSSLFEEKPKGKKAKKAKN